MQLRDEGGFDLLYRGKTACLGQSCEKAFEGRVESIRIERKTDVLAHVVLDPVEGARLPQRETIRAYGPPYRQPRVA